MVKRKNMLLLLLLLLLCGVQGVILQANTAQSNTLDQQSLKDKALFLADALVNHPDFFKQLLKIFEAGGPLLDIGNNDPNVEFLKTHAIDILQDYVHNNANGTILSILADELHRVNVTDVINGFQQKGISPEDPEARRKLTEAIFTRLDKTRALQRILAQQSASSYLPLSPQDKISTPCYRDVIAVFDAIAGVSLPAKESLRFAAVPWTLRMLDATGRPRSSSLVRPGRGQVWAGSRGECERVHALLVPGVTLGSRTLTDVVNFHGQMCRVTLEVPSVASFLNQTNLDSLQWDACVPDTCTEPEVRAFLNLGILKKLKLNVTAVVCIGSDTGELAGSHVTQVSDPSILKAFQRCLQEKTLPSTFTQCFMSVFDHDGNGNVSLTEWSSLDKRDNSARYFMSMDINRNLQIDHSDVMYFYRIFDENADGWLSLPEFEYSWKSLIWSHPLVDIEDPDHLMTSPLLHHVLTTCNHTSSSIGGAAFYNCFIYTFDKNNDGWVSREEFVNTVPREDSLAYFLLLDSNHDLKIDPVDINYIFRLYGHRDADLPLPLQWAPGFPYTVTGV